MTPWRQLPQPTLIPFAALMFPDLNISGISTRRWHRGQNLTGSLVLLPGLFFVILTLFRYSPILKAPSNIGF
jgi:hypothetical protein